MWFIQQFDSLIHLGTCKEYYGMAKAKLPRKSSSKAVNKKNVVNEVMAETTPVTQAEKIAAEVAATHPSVAPAPVGQSKSVRPRLEVNKPEAVKAEAKQDVQKKPEVKPLPTAAADLESAIRQRAYQIFLERRGAPGNPHEDWARAEREVLEAFHHQKSA
jgi:Protein of unknown function (DUF2934)